MVKKLIKKLANGLRKIANKIEQNLSSDIFKENIKIHPSSKISQNRITLKNIYG